MLVVAAQLQSAIGLYRRIDVCGTLRVDVPAAVFELLARDMAAGCIHQSAGWRIPYAIAAGLVQPELQQHVVRLQRRIAFSFTYPVASEVCRLSR